MKPFLRSESVQAALESRRHEIRQDWLRTLHEKLSSLDPADVDSLSIVLCELIKSDFEQKEIADLLKTSRVQVARWTTGSNTPKQPGFRVWVIERVLAFLKEQVEEPARPIQLRRNLRAAAAPKEQTEKSARPIQFRRNLRATAAP